MVRISVVAVLGITTLMLMRAFYWLGLFLAVALFLLLYLAVRKEVHYALLRLMQRKWHK